MVAKFGKTHAQSRKPLARFLGIVRDAEWKHLPDLKAAFPRADYTAESQTVVFNIGGNKYRLIATVNFEKQTLLIENILTHEQYDEKEL